MDTKQLLQRTRCPEAIIFAQNFHIELQFHGKSEVEVGGRRYRIVSGTVEICIRNVENGKIVSVTNIFSSFPEK